jgi:hypothetical protein
MRTSKPAYFQHVEWHPDRAELRRFARAMLIGFFIIGVIFGIRQHQVGQATLVLWTVGATLAVAALIPGLGRFAYLAVHVPTSLLGYVISHVILVVLYTALFTPLGLLLRITGKDLLRLKEPRGSTVWAPRTRARGAESYYRQF